MDFLIKLAAKVVTPVDRVFGWVFGRLLEFLCWATRLTQDHVARYTYLLTCAWTTAAYLLFLEFTLIEGLVTLRVSSYFVTPMLPTIFFKGMDILKRYQRQQKQHNGDVLPISVVRTQAWLKLSRVYLSVSGCLMCWPALHEPRLWSVAGIMLLAAAVLYFLAGPSGGFKHPVRKLAKWLQEHRPRMRLPQPSPLPG